MLAGRRRAVPPARLAWEKRLAASAPSSAPLSSSAAAVNWPPQLAAAVRDIKQTLSAAPKEIATRAASEFALDILTAALPEMVGGSADLTGSNNTRAKGMKASAPPIIPAASSITACASTAWRRR